LALCPFCGNPAGILKRHHPECREKYLRAREQIPALFEKLQHSSIATSRFVELLLTAASSAGVPKDELNALVVEGILRMINSIVEYRLLSAIDERRVDDILSALGIPLESSTSLEGLFVKAQMLLEMNHGKVSDRVFLEGPIPVTLRRSEIAVWAFNRTIGYIHPVREGEMALEPIAEYYTKDAFRVNADSVEGELERTYRGDILLTNYSVHIIDSAKRQARLPISRLLEIVPYTNAVKFTVGPKRREWTCFVNDPWFLANAASVLHRNLRDQRASAE
jgi:hypothetical protein